jgi:rubredoxin
MAKKPAAPPAKAAKTPGQIWECTVCGYQYDEDKEGKKWTDLPEDWVCPTCGATKDQFERKR